MKILSILLLSCNMLFAAPFITDSYIKGKELSEGHHLPMALIFTGSDWSENSKGLLKEILSSDLLKEMVFVHVDFPELNIQSQEILKQNHALKDQYNIHDFPTVVLVGTDQHEITRLRYPIPGISNFTSHLKNLGHRYILLKNRFNKAKKERLSEDLNFCFQEAKKLGAYALSEEILDFGTEQSLSPELTLEKYTVLVGAGKINEAKELRSKLLEEGKEESLSQIALLDFQEKGSIKPLEDFLEKYNEKQSKHFWRLHLIISEFLLDQDQKEEALKHAQVSYRYAPVEDKEQIQKFISKMLH